MVIIDILSLSTFIKKFLKFEFIFSRLFPEDETIEMMPILKKSKEKAKELREKGITPNFRRPTNPSFSSRSSNGIRRGGLNNHHHHHHHQQQQQSHHIDNRGGPVMRGRRKIFLKGKGRINGPPPPLSGIGKKPMFNRMIPKGHLLNRFGGSTTAAAEAYVADYMRNMQYQLPPMPMNPPAGFGSLPPALPRYYDGVPSIPDYPPPSLNRHAPTSSNYDKRSYDEFVWKNKNRNANGALNGANNRDRSRDSRDNYRSGGDKHRNYRR
jgi:hypothetical protein